MVKVLLIFFQAVSLMDIHAFSHHAEDELNLVDIEILLVHIEEKSVLCHRVTHFLLEPFFTLETSFFKAIGQTGL